MLSWFKWLCRNSSILKSKFPSSRHCSETVPAVSTCHMARIPPEFRFRPDRRSPLSRDCLPRKESTTAIKICLMSSRFNYHDVFYVFRSYQLSQLWLLVASNANFFGSVYTETICTFHRFQSFSRTLFPECQIWTTRTKCSWLLPSPLL